MTDVASEAHTKLDLADPRKSMRQLWSSETLRDAPVVRAETHNIVICGARGEMGPDEGPIIELAMAHPGRVIVVETGSDDAELSCDASVYCRVDAGKQVCGELIRVHARGESRDEAHSTIISLLLPDLPVYVWWRGAPPVGDHLFEQISPGANRVYFDSNAFSEPVPDLAALAALPGVRVGDLNWTRLTGWRQLVAQLYDVPDVRAELLKALRSVEVRYAVAGEPANPNRAWLLLSWLAARLGWSLSEASVDDAGAHRLDFDSGAGQMTARLVPEQNPGVENGELVGVSFEAGDISPRVVMGEGHGGLELWLPGGRQASPDRAMPYARRQPASLLAEALVVGRDPDFDAALGMAGQLLAAFK